MPHNDPPPVLIPYFTITGNVSNPDLWTVFRDGDEMQLRWSDGGCPGIASHPLDVDLDAVDTLGFFNAVDASPDYDISIVGAVPGVPAADLEFVNAQCPAGRSAGAPLTIFGPDPG